MLSSDKQPAPLFVTATVSIPTSEPSCLRFYHTHSPYSHCSTALISLTSVPCKPMLGKIAAGIHAMLRRMRGQPFSCEVKYDGLRAQIHMIKGAGRVSMCSRDT